MVEGAANRIMSLVGLEAPDAFLPLVQQDGAVFDDLMAEVTVGETYFFRQPAHFSLVRRTIIPEFRSRATSSQKFRAWSAACSTGEESYSIALTLQEERVPAAVLGTDVSRARLGAARRGVYGRWSFRGVPEQTIEGSFRKDGDKYVVDAAVRRDVEFRYLNLASDRFPALSSGVWGMDLIFCRNVLIYFDRDTIAHVATSLLASLGDDGWLVLGATDPPLHDFVKCEVVQTDEGLAYRHFKGISHRSMRTTSTPAFAHATPVAPVSVTPPVIVMDLPTPAAESARAPLAPAAAVQLASQAYEDRDYDRTIEIVGPLTTGGTATPNELVLYVRALANLGRLEEANGICVAALDRVRDVPELHYLHAVLVAQSGQFGESVLAARRALYLDRTMVVAQLALGAALVSNGETEAALRAFTVAERLLAAMPPEAQVPASDGEPAGRLLEMTRMQAKLARREFAA
jgi:chemotaxis protein methyltransferase CheR